MQAARYYAEYDFTAKATMVVDEFIKLHSWEVKHRKCFQWGWG